MLTKLANALHKTSPAMHELRQILPNGENCSFKIMRILALLLKIAAQIFGATKAAATLEDAREITVAAALLHNRFYAMEAGILGRYGRATCSNSLQFTGRSYCQQRHDNYTAG